VPLAGAGLKIFVAKPWVRSAILSEVICIKKALAAMAIWGRVKKVGKPLVDAPRWMGAEELRDNFVSILGLIKRYFVLKPRASSVAESFDESIERQNLDAAQLKVVQQRFLFLAAFALVLAIAVLIYTVYLYFHADWQAVMLSFVIFCMVLSFAFRHHFWWYQMRTRQLGVSFSEWFRYGLLGGKK
jgi:intracellular multiplication protein IcmV